MLDRFAFAGFVLLSLGAFSGCGPATKAGPSGLVPVSGTVSLDGSPLPGATVSFIPVDSNAGSDAGGVTDQSGKYELKAGEGAGTGAKPGEYRVVVSRLMKDGSPVMADKDKSPMQLMLDGAKESVPEKYSDVLKSELKASVPAGGGTVNLELKK